MENTPHNFSVEDNKRFWDSNESHYYSAKHAGNIYFLCRNYLGKEILDAGAGDGSMMRALGELCPGSAIRAIDLSPKSDDVEQGDLTSLPYPDDSFDTVLFIEVIEHLTSDDIKAIVSELKRVLKPGGHMIVTTPYKENLKLAQVCCPQCATVFHRYGHQHSFSDDDIKNILTEAGLKPVDVSVIKMNRIKRLKFLGAGFLKSAFMQRKFRKASGQKNVICVARN